MKIQIDPHTLERAEERGTNEEEIKDVIKTGVTISGKYGRIGKAKVYDFTQKRHHQFDHHGNRVRFLWEMGGQRMNVSYNDRKDLLYIRLDDRRQNVVNRRVSENVVLDLGEGDKIIGIEILDASKYTALEKLLPVTYEVPK